MFRQRHLPTQSKLNKTANVSSLSNNLYNVKGSVDNSQEEALKKQAEHNYENRCLHYHVFDTSHVIEIVHYLNLQIIDVEPLLVCHILIIARKVQAENFPNNDKYLVNDAKYRHTSPFMSGRH